MPVSEILHAPGVDFAGKLAPGIQLNQIFAAAAVAGSKQAEAAKRLIAFLASDGVADAIRASGMEPLGKRRAN
jgi:molybdate transport system substrate-binding protein